MFRSSYEYGLSVAIVIVIIVIAVVIIIVVVIITIINTIIKLSCSSPALRYHGDIPHTLSPVKAPLAVSVALHSQVDAVFSERRGAAVVDLESQTDEVALEAGPEVQVVVQSGTHGQQGRPLAAVERPHQGLRRALHRGKLRGQL